MDAILTRIKDDGKQTVGGLFSDSAVPYFRCDTLELPWLADAPNISCIPIGIYKVKWTYSQRHGKYMYQIMDIPNRTGIRFDVANYAKQLLGCVALGKGYGDINDNGKIDILHSQLTNDLFNAYFRKQDFTLKIVEQGIMNPL